jgi:L-fuculokinase
MQDKDACTLVLDIGKSNAKLVLIDAAGEVIARAQRANAPGPSEWQGRALPYVSLGVAALEAWLLDAIPALPQRERIRHLSVSTHGAAFCAIGDDGLALPPIDYEWDGYGEHRLAFEQAIDPFEHTGSPLLPLGLNAGLQLFWLQRTQPQSWARIRLWLPYPQYWAWWFSGVAASEVSSLGCHTQLWSPSAGGYSSWAQGCGIAALFAPMRRAWDVLGHIRPGLAERLGLDAACEIHCGVHDSNACLARYLPQLADATLLTTGTWTVAMSPGGDARELRPERDELLNVAVDGRPVPTARFMGGREFGALCGGADPALATEAALAEVLDQGWQALPAFAESGGPFQGRRGEIRRHDVRYAEGVSAVPAELRPALAALYCAQVSAGMLAALGSGGPVILEGPLARNAAFGAALAALLEGDRALLRSVDRLEGTARGAWQLAHWKAAPSRPRDAAALQALATPTDHLALMLRKHHAAWRQALPPR